MANTSFISREKFISVTSELISRYNPNPDDPEPIGPWGPVIKKAIHKSRLEWIALNPQPLPPRMVSEVADRARLLYELAGALKNEGKQSGIIIVGGYISRFTDYCGNEVIKFHHPKRGPVTVPDRVLDSIDLIGMGLQFHKEAKNTDDPKLQKVFADAGDKLIQMGMERDKSTTK